jgi:hypothetical protein
MSRLNLPFPSSLAMLVLAAAAAAQSPADCQPSMWRSGSPAVGADVDFTLQAAPSCLVAQLLSLDPGPTVAFGRSFAIGASPVALPLAVVPASGLPVTGRLRIPNTNTLAGVDIFHLALGVAPVAPSDPAVGPAGRFRIHGTSPQSGSVVVLGEQALDNGHSQVIAAGQRLGVPADVLTNDNNTVLVGNPWLVWSERFAGDVVTLPMGLPGGEGMFTLPNTLPWPLASFVAGTLSQPQLDNIPGVTAIGNRDLAAMVGQTFVAVVYDGSIGINYQPLLANLQGGRCGRFAFTVLDVLLPGTISESNSSTSLYDLVVAPMAAPTAFQRAPRPESADSVQITTAEWRNGRLTIDATSALGSLADMTVSVDGFTFESPMAWNGLAAQFEARFRSPLSLVGRRVTISSRQGGSYTITVQ